MLSNNEQFFMDVARDYKNAFDLVLCENEELKNMLSEAEIARQTDVGNTQHRLDKANSALLNEEIKFQGAIKLIGDYLKDCHINYDSYFEAKRSLESVDFALWNVWRNNHKEVV